MTSTIVVGSFAWGHHLKKCVPLAIPVRSVYNIAVRPNYIRQIQQKKGNLCSVNQHLFPIQSRMNSTAAIQSNSSNPNQQAITAKLKEKFNPIHLEVINESFMHSVPNGSETHFKVIVVSDAFDSMSVIQRHRAVNACLDHELKHGVHALSITARTAKQWNANSNVSPSPNCLGGRKYEAEKQSAV